MSHSYTLVSASLREQDDLYGGCDDVKWVRYCILDHINDSTIQNRRDEETTFHNHL